MMKSGLEKMIDAMFGPMIEAVKNGEMSEEAFGDNFIQIYEDIIGKYGPVAKLVLPKLTEKATDDFIVPLAKSLIMAISKVMDNMINDEVYAEFLDKKARLRKLTLDAYIKAGFERQEAMNILLLDESNLKSNFQGIGNK